MSGLVHHLQGDALADERFTDHALSSLWRIGEIYGLLVGEPHLRKELKRKADALAQQGAERSAELCRQFSARIDKMFIGEPSVDVEAHRLDSVASVETRAIEITFEREGGRWLERAHRNPRNRLPAEAGAFSRWLPKAVFVDRYARVKATARWLAAFRTQGIVDFEIIVARVEKNEMSEESSTDDPRMAAGESIRTGDARPGRGPARREEPKTRSLRGADPTLGEFTKWDDLMAALIAAEPQLPKDIKLKLTKVRKNRFQEICHGRFLALYHNRVRHPGKAYYLDQGLAMWQSSSAERQPAFDVLSEEVHRVVQELAKADATMLQRPADTDGPDDDFP